MSKQKVRFDHYSDSNGTRRVFICYIEENGYLARGVALCSFQDSPNDKLGKRIAFGRAYKALLSGTSSRKTMCSKHARRILVACGLPLLDAPKASYILAEQQAAVG